MKKTGNPAADAVNALIDVGRAELGSSREAITAAETMQKSASAAAKPKAKGKAKAKAAA